MPTTWIVSANAGHATIFAQPNATAELQRVEDLDNPPARMRDGDIETGDLGNRSASNSLHGVGLGPSQPSGYQPNQSPVEHETENLARRLVGYLEKAHQQGRFGELCIVAAPEFLGEIRGVMNKTLHGTV